MEKMPPVREFYNGFSLLTECGSGDMHLVAGIVETRSADSEGNKYFWIIADEDGQNERADLRDKVIASRPLGHTLATARLAAAYLETPLCEHFIGNLETVLQERGLSIHVMDKETIYKVLADLVPPMPHGRIIEFAKVRKNIDAVPVAPWEIEGNTLKKLLDEHIPRTKKYDDLNEAFESIAKLDKEILWYLRSYLEDLKKAKLIRRATPLWTPDEVAQCMRFNDSWASGQLKKLSTTLQTLSRQCGYLDNLHKGLIGNGKFIRQMIIDGDGNTETVPDSFAEHYLRNVPANSSQAFANVQSDIEKGLCLIDTILQRGESEGVLPFMEGKLNVLVDSGIYRKTVTTLHGCKAQLEKLKEKMSQDYPDLQKEYEKGWRRA